jgi:uncharacterized protein
MIERSFILLPGVGITKERQIKQYVPDWNTFLAAATITGISSQRKRFYDKFLCQAKQALHDDNMPFFVQHLPLAEHWRLYTHFREDALFLDIEVEHVTKDLTVIGMYNGQDTKIMIQGKNMHLPTIKKELQKAKVVVTYNGNIFDIPFLRKKYPGLLPNIPCFDVAVGCRRLGLLGGLKKVEETLGIHRDNRIVRELRSGQPYQLYKMWKNSGDEHYLRLLVEYNEEDVISLQRVADHICKELTTLEEQSLKS